MKPSYTSRETLNRAQKSADRFFDVPYGSFISRVHPELPAEYRRKQAACTAEVSQRREEALRLVKAAKSPTDPESARRVAKFLQAEGAWKRHEPRFVEKPEPWAGNNETPGTWAVVERRDWCGEYRIRTETRPASSDLPPEQAGDRITAMLTDRGARKISESCYYVATARTGYTTFLTLTLSEEAREKLALKVLVPCYPMESGYLKAPITPARAKQGPFAPDYSHENQITRADQVATISGDYAALHPDTGRPYTPLKEAWAWSVQKEASRFFEAMGQMYRRGWQFQNEQGETVKVKGSRALYCVEGLDTDGSSGAEYTRLKWWREPLDYLWVAENPDRIDEETGEVMGQNPHLHILMRWRVPYHHFAAWAERIERLWGQGFAHLEKLKDPAKAGGYVAKAAGYLSKSQGKTDQGCIRGNRYGISSRARAPGWIECDRHQVGMMGWLLAEASELWQNKHGEKIQRRDNLKRQLEAVNDPARRQKIGRLLEKVRAEIEPLPRLSKYGAVFKSEEQKDCFLTWCRRRGWSDKPQCSQWLHQWRQEQWRRRNATRLRASANEWADWFALADSGAVDCSTSEETRYSDQVTEYFEGHLLFEPQHSLGYC